MVRFVPVWSAVVLTATLSAAGRAEASTALSVRADAFPGAVTGVFVTPARPVVVTATGSWSVGGPYGTFGPAGSISFGTESCAHVTSVPMGALVGSLDNGATWFAIGAGPTTVTGLGALLLSANDCPGPNGSFFSDNQGALAVATAQALAPAGAVLGWGSNSGAQSGPVGVDLILGLPPQSVGLANAIAVAGGCCHSAALTADGTVWGWGANFSGQLGDREPGPTPLPIARDMTAIAAGSYHMLALKADGTVWGWGFNFYGELGRRLDSTTPAYAGPSYPTPQQVLGIDHVVAIAAGNFTSMALKDDGTVWGWGYNNEGEIGIENHQGPDPQRIHGLDQIVAIALGGANGLALKSDGTVWGWGDNTFGQVAANGPGPIAPRQIISGMVGIAAGTQHCLALAADGSVWGWGHNFASRVGVGPQDLVLPPQKVLDAVGTVALSASTRASLALNQDGTVWKWGDGDGVPKPVRGLLHARGIGAGWDHQLAILEPAWVSAIDLANVQTSAGAGNVTVPVTLTRAGIPAASKSVRVIIDFFRPVVVAITDVNGRASATITGLSVGTHRITAVFDGDLESSSAAAQATLDVRARSTPAITWPAPSAITYGTALSAAQLNATALVGDVGVAGSFHYTPAAGTILNAGAAQTLSVTFTPDDTSRYDTVTASTSLDVERAPLTVTALNATRLLGADNPAFDVSYSGFTLGEGPGVLTSPVVVTTTATASSPVGAYPITPGGAAAMNYALSFVPGTLTITHNVCALYDQSTPKKSGSTVPIRVALCDAARTNVSAPSVILNVQSVTLISGVADGPVEDAGNANPDGNFRYDAGLGGYIFNLQTTGLAIGTYELTFTVAGDPVIHRVRFAVK